jgi:hypothetical protein
LVRGKRLGLVTRETGARRLKNKKGKNNEREETYEKRKAAMLQPVGLSHMEIYV